MIPYRLTLRSLIRFAFCRNRDTTNLFSGDSPGPMQILRPDGEHPRNAAQGLIPAARNIFTINPLGLRRRQSTLNKPGAEIRRRREWSTRDKILFALGQKWGKR